MCYTLKQYENRIRKLDALEAQKAALESEIAALKAEIQTDMGDTEAIETDRFIIRWPVIVSNQFDSSAFKADHGELYEAYRRPKESRRFTYKLTV